MLSNIKINEQIRDITSEQLVDKELTRLFPRRVIKRILLVVPPDVDVSIFNYTTAKRGRCWNYPPYGLGIIATHLRDEGLSVKITNLNNEILKECSFSNSESDFNFDDVWKTKLSEEITDFQPDIVGISCMFTQTHSSAVNVCNEIRRLNPVLPIAIGGVHITNCFVEDKMSDILLKDFKKADIFFLYEAELAFKQFIKMVNRVASLNKLYQVFFNSSSDRLYFPEKKIPTEDELNIIPAHDLMTPTELMNYGVIGSFFCMKEKGTKITTILSNRGCRGQCTYCSVRNFNGIGVRHRSVESVIEELDMLRNKYDIRHVMWLDDDFLHDHKRTLHLFTEMIKRNLGITWDCTNGVIAASCTDEIIAAAAESGCIGLTIGVESGNSQVLKKIRKPGNINIFIKAAEILKKYEQINTRAFLMIGLPDETYRMIYDTVRLALKMDLDWYNITIFEPLPNTPIFESVLQKDELNPTEFKNIKYNSGSYGKFQEKLNGNQFYSALADPFININLDAVPPKSQLNNIWFYMNYHLNFKRLYKVNNPIKLEQQLKYVQNITDLVAPEDPFPMYFCGYLQKKLRGKIDEQLIKRLEEVLQFSEYWRKRFEFFGLSADKLKSLNFSEELQYRLKPFSIAKNGLNTC
ncbi:B12-binding domain-containing radical SAM protein [bacterium]|nr:B12-binding domain-containing radical SAM protein [bacterium]MBU3956624.1 B12-binding domain-containing radical SAM protein [bacterium]